MAGRCWPGAAECRGSGGCGLSIWEREEDILQAVGGCAPFVEGQGPRRQQWWLVWRGRVQRGPVFRPGMVVALAE